MRRKLLRVCLMAILCLTSTAVWALDKVGDAYQIGSTDDLRAFAELVNGGETLANAVLTADVVSTPDMPMIGTDANRFDGIFDGQGHTVTLDAYPTANGSGLFQYIGWKGVVKNLVVDGQISTSNSFAGGIAGYNRGVITSCISKVTINSTKAGDATHGGIVGIQYIGGKLTNCLAVGEIKGEATTNCGGLVGWLDARCVVMNNLSLTKMSLAADPDNTRSIARNGGNIRVGMNLYLTREKATTDDEGIQITEEELKNGNACFVLNSDQSNIVWTQTLGEDEYPVPFQTRKQVFASSVVDCAGNVGDGATFSNESGATAPKHVLVGGKCQNCYYWNPFLAERDAEGYFLLKDKDCVDWFVKDHEYGGEYHSARLLTDVDYTDRTAFLTPSYWFSGEFDGMGHTIEIAIPDNGVENNAPFPNIAGAKISNLAVKGTVETSNKFASGLVGHANSTPVNYLSNILVDVQIISHVEGDGTHGTIVAVPNAETYITNCISLGSITTPEGTTDMCGGLIGYAGASTHLRNVAFLGDLDVAFNITYDSDIISRNSGNCTFENVFYLPELKPGVAAPAAAVKTTAEDVASGALAYQLNGDQAEIGIWQTIGTDAYPTPIKGQSQQVYASPSGGYRCDGKTIGNVTYSNTYAERVIPDHTWDGAFCQVCGVFNTDFKQPNGDGFYELSSAKDLVWFSYKVNYEAKANLNALLTEDIYMEDDDNEKFNPIGNVNVKYVGTFDGQFHRIHNLKIIRPEEQYTGLFGMVTGGATIKNLVLAEDCTISGAAFTGLIGGSNGGGTIIMECLGNEGETISSAQNAGGIYGCNMGAAATPIFRNCYVTGPVTGARESGQITGYAGNGQAYNCYASGAIPLESVYYKDWSDAMLRGGPKSENCYSIYADKNAKVVTDEDVENGTLAWLLNGEKFDNVIFRQTIDEDTHPVFDADHGVVYKFGEQIGYVLGDDISELRDALVQGELEYIQNEELKAQQALKDAYEAKVNALSDATTLDELVAGYNELKEDKKVIADCAASYQAYIKKVNETIAYLTTHNDFEGGDRDFLADYLESDAEPSEDNPNGGALYIIDYQLLSKEEVEAETLRIDELLRVAILNGFVAGTEVTQFMTNPDFHDSFNGWEGQKGTGVGGPFELGEEGSTKTYYGAEHITRTKLDMYQTIKMPKKGFYLFALDAAYRPANSFYSYSHGAYIYANGTNMLVPTVHEAMMPVDEAIDQVNCNLTGGTNDQPIYLNPAEPIEEEIAGYGLHGQLSVAIAIMAGRIQNSIIGEVGEDSLLTVGIANPHGYSNANEWVGFGNARLIYLGETLEGDAADKALTQTLDGDLARANTILTLYTFSDDTDYAQAPNYTQALKDELQALVNEAASAGDAAAKYDLIKKFSDLFGRIYESRMAYAGMFGRAEGLAIAADEMRDVLGEEQANALQDAAQKAFADYSNGILTTEEALAALTDIDLLPQKVDGVYQIKTAVHMALFASSVNAGETDACAVLMNDIDMGGKLLEDGTPDPEGYFFTPIGTINNKPYAGTFDGQGHTIKNLVIDTGAEYTGLFGGVTGGAVIKNFIVDKNSYIGGAAFTALIGGNNTAGQIYVQNIGMEGRVVSSAQNAAGIYGCNNGNAGTPHILNCYVSGSVTGARESAQVCGWMGANGSEIIGCWATGAINGVYNTAAGAGDAFYRGTAGKTAYCYSTASARNSTVGAINDGDLTSGKLTYNVNGGDTDDPAWFQKLGEGGDPHPMLWGSDIVYLFNGQYTNEKHTIELNAYAYAISTDASDEGVKINYSLNANARAAKINFKKGDEVVYSQELSADDLTKGQHTVAVDNSNLPEAGTELTYDIEVTSFGVTEPYRIKAPTESGTYSFWRPYSIAANTNPESARFGDLYVTESGYDNKTTSGYHSDLRHNGLFAFDAEFRAIPAADGIYGFQGGVDMSYAGLQVLDGTEAFEPKSVTFSQDGRLFVGVMGGKTNSPIYEANPEDLNEPWTPLFTGGEVNAQTGVTWIGDQIQAGMMADITTSGAGESLKLWTLACGRSDGKANVTDYFAYTYDLGTKKQWDAAPSGQVDVLMNQWTIAPGGVQIAADNQGGLWYVQYRDKPSETQPALKHINAEGKVDCDRPTEVLPGAGIAISPDGSIMAMVTASGQVTVYNVSYAPNPAGMIIPSPKYTFSTAETRITCLAFDYAGNLYAGSPSTETVNRYALPSWSDNVTVTPAPSSAAFTVGIQSVAADGVRNGEIYTLGGVRLQKAQKGVNIINGNKVLVK